MADFIILDFETTGLSKTMHKITEVAALKVRNGEIVDKFETLVNPLCKIPKHITGITGITNEMVKDSPTIDTVLKDFLGFVGDGIIVAHNAEFDYGFLSHHAQEILNHKVENHKLCTRKLARRLLPDIKKRSLSEICKHLEIYNESAHRAMGDVKATFQVFNKFKEMMYSSGINKPEEMIDFCHSRLSR